MTDRTTVQLQLVAEINRRLSEAQIPHWLFGGWSVDFHAGAVTREHDDVELFIWQRDAARAGGLMNAAGYERVDHPHPEEALIWRKHGQIVELYFTVVNAQGQIVVQGRWNNWPLPEDALGNEIRMVEEVECPVVSLECIRATKQGYERYSGFPPREKDRDDLTTLHNRTT
jgi:hypothetical protein